MTEEKHLDKIDKYFQCRMSELEIEAFKTELDSDTELRALFDFVQDTKVATDFHAKGRLKSVLQDQERHLQKKTSYRRLQVAASIALLATFGYFILDGNNPDREALYNRYYEVYPNIVDPARRSSDGLSSIYQLYENKQYDASLQFLEAKETSDTIMFYMAQSQLALEQYQSAKVNFANIGQASVFSEAAQWYEALILLKMEEDALLDSKLQEIIERDGSYRERAIDLKEMLTD